jgi:hypothetical protein
MVKKISRRPNIGSLLYQNNEIPCMYDILEVSLTMYLHNCF